MKLNARDSGEEGKMLKHCVKTTISSLLKAISKLHTNRAPIGDAHKLFLSDTSTCTRTHTHIASEQDNGLCMYIMPLMACGTDCGEETQSQLYE